MSAIDELTAKVALSRRLIARAEPVASMDPTAWVLVREALVRDVAILEAKLAWLRDGAPERRGWREYLMAEAA